MIYQNSITNCTTPIPYEKGKKNGNMIYSQSFHISKQESLWGCCNNSLFSQNACRFFFHFLFCMLVTANNCKRHSTLLVTFDSNVHVKQYFLFLPQFFFSFFFLNLTCKCCAVHVLLSRFYPNFIQFLF